MKMSKSNGQGLSTESISTEVRRLLSTLSKQYGIKCSSCIGAILEFPPGIKYFLLYLV